MKIGKHDVTERVFVIAEIGINHNGDIHRALNLQQAAADAGADAVKYQVGDPEKYVRREKWDTPRELEDGTVVPYIDYRKSLELNDDRLGHLQRHAKRLGLEWFASPLDWSAVPRLEELCVPCYKIASPMVTDLVLLGAVAKTAVPVLCSSGMTTLSQLDTAINTLGYADTAILHCTSEYPCPPEHNNLRMIETLRAHYPGRPIGYSGHELGIPQSIAAVAMGAQIIERHLTLSRADWGSDQSASLEPRAFDRMVGYIRTIETALGDGVKRTYDGERINEAKFRRS